MLCCCHHCCTLPAHLLPHSLALTCPANFGSPLQWTQASFGLCLEQEADCGCSCTCLFLQETQTKPEGQIHFFPIIMDGAPPWLMFCLVSV